VYNYIGNYELLKWNCVLSSQLKNCTVFRWEVPFACVHFAIRCRVMMCVVVHQTEHGSGNKDVRDTIADHLRSCVATEENTSVTHVSFVMSLFNCDPTAQCFPPIALL
jgi:cAMP phosphodiesterase